MLRCLLKFIIPSSLNSSHKIGLDRTNLKFGSLFSFPFPLPLLLPLTLSLSKPYWLYSIHFYFQPYMVPIKLPVELSMHSWINLIRYDEATVKMLHLPNIAGVTQGLGKNLTDEKSAQSQSSPRPQRMLSRPKMTVLLITPTPGRSYGCQARQCTPWDVRNLGKFCGWKVAQLSL